MYQSLGKMSIFYAENHNNPMVSDDKATFRYEYFQEYKELPEGCRYFIFYDPALPPSGRTRIKKVDYSAILVLATDSSENWYVVEVNANRDTPSDNRELIYKLANKYTYDEQAPLVQMETIAAQRGMYLEIKKEMSSKGHKFPLREIPSHIGSKEARIEQLQPLYEAGRIYHCKGQCDDLEKELIMFGRNSHDDISDCLSFAIGRVKYPTTTRAVKKRSFDTWDKFFNKPSDQSWKIL
jgi:predicted phage terminase large subunit-like protein